jgi:hypothetical protein
MPKAKGGKAYQRKATGARAAPVKTLAEQGVDKHLAKRGREQRRAASTPLARSRKHCFMPRPYQCRRKHAPKPYRLRRAWRWMRATG